MVISDPIGDLLTRLRNASAANHDSLELPDSKIKREILRILQSEGYIKSYEVIQDTPQNRIKVALKYSSAGGQRRSPVLTGLKRVSRPGLRVYVPAAEIPIVQRGLGISIMTTSRGLMTGKQAKRLGVGGELLAYIY
ncbi:MAG TPA: 30S ribosomal protein S8 [Armatimonadaceae bacterium]|jgi:small subunit ribosomal protein S8|nr:30S ribosomal protein S8 [Armatimonadaceae bacterium]